MFDIGFKNDIQEATLNEIWKKEYKQLVKNVDPKLLKSRKRGKRGDVRVNMSIKDGRVPLPGTNARSVRTKLDELHGLLHTKKVKNLAHLICITES